MYSIGVEFVVSVNEMSAEEVVRVLNALGAKSLGSYAEKYPHFGRGYRYLGNIIQVGTLLFTLTWDNENSKVCMNPASLNTNCVPTDNLPVTVTGSQSGDTALFASKEDAIAWLNNMSSIEQLKLSVKTADYNGPAVMFLAQ